MAPMTNRATSEAALIIGASSGIARALIEAFRRDPGTAVITVSRSAADDTENGDRHITCDYSQAGIEQACQDLHEWKGRIRTVVICNGILHEAGLRPEKRLEALDMNALHHYFQVNAFVPALWTSRLLPLLKREQNTTVAAISARVGSISENNKGGWYGYRASKAALNMLLKTAAIEYARRAPNVKLLVFQPGTTDTPLSAPFQRGVPEGKLFTPAFVADRLRDIMAEQEPDGELSFLDWAGETVGW